MSKLLIIIGTTRPNRFTPSLAKWVLKSAEQTEGLQPEIVDLADYALPYMDEPISPRYNPDRSPNPIVKKWMNKMNEGDAYVFVTPEYNHSIPGVLKNAIDYLTFEMDKKPATVVSHGTVGGARATMHLKEILSESKAAIIPSQVALAGASDKIDENGELNEEQKALRYGPQTALANALLELKWYAGALASARTKTA